MIQGSSARTADSAAMSMKAQSHQFLIQCVSRIRTRKHRMYAEVTYRFVYSMFAINDCGGLIYC
jgi:hypothetical protein